MTDEPQSFAASQLRSIVERVERVEVEIRDLNRDKADIYAEAKGNGYDVKALKTVVRIRAQDANSREEFEAVLDTYKNALGIV